MTRIGCDTGFFKHLLNQNPKALTPYQEAQAGKTELIVSCISLYELRKLGLKGEIDKNKAFEITTLLPKFSTIVWLDQNNQHIQEEAARIAHGNNLAMADSLILSSLISANVSSIYTTDKDFSKYPKAPDIILL